VVALAAAVVPVALADGDPASDYLISQQSFLPISENVSLSLEGEFTRLVDDAKQKGFPLKVAVIAKPVDLGAVPSLFGKPETYASFLGQEDYYFFKDELLVVMPQGYGLFKAKTGVPAGDRRAIAALHGKRLSAAPAPPSGGGGHATRDRLEILAIALCGLAIVAIFAIPRRRRRARASRATD